MGARSAALFTDGLLLWTPCDGEETRWVLTGTVVDGVGAWAVVETVEGVAFAGHVDAAGVEVRVRGPARLSFSNDLFSAGRDRNLRVAVP